MNLTTWLWLVVVAMSAVTTSQLALILKQKRKLPYLILVCKVGQITSFGQPMD